MAFLARETIPHLDRLDVSISIVIAGSIVLGFTQISLAVATGNIFSTSLVCLGVAVPVFLAFPLTEIGSSCDNLMEKLN